MTALSATAPSLSRRWAALAFAPVLLHALASRLVFDLALVVGGVFKAAKFDPTRDYAWPSQGETAGRLAAGAVNYGDFDWYRSVIVRGYDRVPFDGSLEHNWAFFPLQPMMLRLVEAPAAQFLVGHLAFFAAVALLFAYLRRATDEPTATASIALMVWFPFSFTISQFRPETFLLLFSALALVLAQSGRRWDAAIAAGLAGLAKPNAFLLALLLLPEAWRERPRVSLRDALAKLSPSTLALLAAPASGLVFLTLYLWNITGEPLAWAKIQGAWGAKFLERPLEQAAALVTNPLIVGRGGWDPTVLHWTVLAAAAVATGYLVLRRRYVFALYIAGYVCLTFANHGVFAIGKHLSTCFPVFVGLALMLRGREGFALVLAGSAALLALNGVFAALGFNFVRA